MLCRRRDPTGAAFTHAIVHYRIGRREGSTIGKLEPAPLSMIYPSRDTLHIRRVPLICFGGEVVFRHEETTRIEQELCQDA